MKVLCLGKCFQLLIKERSGLSKDEELPSHLIPTTFKEETYILEDEGILMLKQVYFSSYWRLRKNFLDLVEDLLSQDSLISTKSRGKDISCASKISSPSMMSHDIKSSKVSILPVFTLRISIMPSCQNLILRNAVVKKSRSLKKVGNM